MSPLVAFIICTVLILLAYIYRKRNGEGVYRFIAEQASNTYERFAPYSFKVVREKVKELGQEYTPRQYLIQVLAFAVGAGVITYLYFYSILISIAYAVAAVAFIPYLAYLRCHRLYSEFIFEQVQVYTTNVIMEFATTQSFVKSLEGVYESGVLEDPIKTDVKIMLDLAYQNGTIDESIEYMNNKYDFHIVRNMHQLFLQITNEGSRNAAAPLENMSQDIDMLVENVYRDRLDRAQFHKKFIFFGIILYLMIMLVQMMIGVDSYLNLLNNILVQLLLHGIVIINTFFLISGEKYYNENVGAE